MNHIYTQPTVFFSQASFVVLSKHELQFPGIFGDVSNPGLGSRHCRKGGEAKLSSILNATPDLPVESQGGGLLLQASKAYFRSWKQPRNSTTQASYPELYLLAVESVVH
jgi:hypothetical protein